MRIESKKNNPGGFELWDSDSGNCIGFYPTEKEALASISESIADNGEEYADTLALLRIDAKRELETIAVGADLAVRARQAAIEAANKVARESQPQGSKLDLLTKPDH